jgi:hypothetical protein
MEIKSLYHVMPTVYSLQRRPGNGRNRHALYHFYNSTNHAIPALTLSPNMFYFNTVLQGPGAPNNVKLDRLVKLSGGNLKKAATMLRGTVRNRYKNIKPYIRDFAKRQNYPYLNSTNLTRIPDSQMTHWRHYKRYANLLGLLGNRANPRRTYYNKKQIANGARHPPVNRNLVQKFNQFYRIYTLGSRGVSQSNMRQKLQRFHEIQRKITQNATNAARATGSRRTRAATHIQSVARGMLARRQASAARTAAATARRTPLRFNAPAFAPRRVNAAATANLHRILGINASRR